MVVKIGWTCLHWGSQPDGLQVSVAAILGLITKLEFATIYSRSTSLDFLSHGQAFLSDIVSIACLSVVRVAHSWCLIWLFQLNTSAIGPGHVPGRQLAWCSKISSKTTL